MNDHEDSPVVQNALRELEGVPRGRSEGLLAGVQITQRKIAHLAYDAGWKNEDFLELVVACMVCGSESWRFSRAHNDNIDANGDVLSRDVGLMEINIPASKIGTQTEEDLYDPVKNFAAAYLLYSNRKWQPWAAFNSGVYLHDTYLQWGLLGVANLADEFLLKRAQDVGQQPGTRLPWISIKELKKLYPSTVLG